MGTLISTQPNKQSLLKQFREKKPEFVKKKKRNKRNISAKEENDVQEKQIHFPGCLGGDVFLSGAEGLSLIYLYVLLIAFNLVKFPLKVQQLTSVYSSKNDRNWVSNFFGKLLMLCFPSH